MFKLIGIIVFVVVLVVGYPALSLWYSGDATPKEAMDEIRGKLSDTLATDKNAQGKDDSNDTSQTESKDNQISKSGKSNNKSNAEQPTQEVDNLQKMINEVNKN
jgi:hypothetical protein